MPATQTDGLLIKTRPMNAVTNDAASGVLTLGAGAVNGELIRTLRGGDWMLPIGTCPTVGVAGLVLGGGIGDNTRWAGMTCDHLVSLDLVLASGDIVAASSVEHPDLFWACRGGGGGNFGIATTLTFQAVPLRRKSVTVYQFLFHGSEIAARAFHAYSALMQSAPPELSGFADLSSIPSGADPSRGSPPGMLGNPSIAPTVDVEGSYQGPADDVRDLLRPVYELAEPDRFEITEMDFWDAQINWLAVPPRPPHGWSDYARYADAAFSMTSAEAIVNQVLHAPFGDASNNAEIMLHCWTGGPAINGVAPEATAYVHRNATSLLRASAWWLPQTPAADQARALAWLDQAFATIRPFTTGASFVNWPNASLPNWADAYYGANLPRLSEIKRAYDPQNVFRFGQSIPLSI